MIKLWEPVVRIIFYEIHFVLNRFKRCDISVSNTGFTSFRIRTIVFRMILICDVVFVLVYTFKPKKCITYVCMNTCLGSTPLTETPAFRIFCGQNIRGRNVRGRNALHSHKHDDDHSLRESHIQCDFSNEYHQHTGSVHN